MKTTFEKTIEKVKFQDLTRERLFLVRRMIEKEISELSERILIETIRNQAAIIELPKFKFFATLGWILRIRDMARNSETIRSMQMQRMFLRHLLNQITNENHHCS